MHLNSEFTPQHWSCKRVSNPLVGWEVRAKPMKPWVRILGEIAIGLLLAAGIVMAFFNGWLP